MVKLPTTLIFLSVLTFTRLHLPAEIVPATHKKVVRPARPGGLRPGGGGEGAYRPPRGGGDRDDYREKESAPSDFRPQYVGGCVP